MDALQTLIATINRVDVKEPVGKKAQDNVDCHYFIGCCWCGLDYL